MTIATAAITTATGAVAANDTTATTGVILQVSWRAPARRATSTTLGALSTYESGRGREVGSYAESAAALLL